VAAISASRNCRRVLQAAGQLARFDALVDGQTAAEENLRGKAAQIAYAARKLGIEPARCVLLEDATSGVSAGREAGCGLVVGVDRAGGDHRDALRRAGADLVVEDVASLRFLRSIPTVHQKRRLFDDLRAGRPLCLFLDFDGTLSPIVPDPAAASISAGLRATVRRLADRQTVAVISGRDLDDVRRRMGIEGLFYAGSHGLDIVGPGRAMAHPDAEAAAGAVDRAESALHQLVGEVPGTVIERKRFSVAAHYRMVDPAHAERVKTAAVRAAAADDRLQARHGKMVVEILPDIAWDKGRAVAWLLEALTVDPRETLVIHIGDDETDEDAFLALAGRGLGIFVGPEANASLADLRLEDPAAVETFLEGLHEI
jgi:trehalose-phosphatase